MSGLLGIVEEQRIKDIVMQDALTKKKKKKKDCSGKIEKMKGQIAEHQGLIEIMLENLSSKTEKQEIDNFLEFVTASKRPGKKTRDGLYDGEDKSDNQP